MRLFSFASFASVALLALASCSSPASNEETSSTSSAESQGDQSDTSCQVVLRHTYIDFQGRFGPETDCSSGTCWVVIHVYFDVAMSHSLAESTGFVFYKGGTSASWMQSAPAQPIFGAPMGFRRYHVVLRSNTFEASTPPQTVSLVPFIATVAGARLFDHNRIPDSMGSYSLTADDNWTINDDSSCAGAPPATIFTATFATGWANATFGSLAANGKLDVSYDIYRMPQTLTCTTDGVAAFATMANVQFQPGGQILTERANGPFDSATGKYDSTPLEFDVPAGTRSASLWFQTSSDCTGATQWDSNFGQNYTVWAQ